MRRNGIRTRAQMLDIAEAMVLANGLSAASLRAIARAMNVTKGAVAHHFPDKDALARALIHRTTAQDLKLLHALLERARRRNGDPLKCMLSFLRSLEKAGPALLASSGSLRAALGYQNCDLSKATNAVLSACYKRIGEFYAALFGEILETYRPVKPASAAALGESLNALIEGAALLARVQRDPNLASRAIAAFRRQLEAMFDRGKIS